jgi:hypothetical protein
VIWSMPTGSFSLVLALRSSSTERRSLGSSLMLPSGIGTGSSTRWSTDSYSRRLPRLNGTRSERSVTDGSSTRRRASGGTRLTPSGALDTPSGTCTRRLPIYSSTCPSPTWSSSREISTTVCFSLLINVAWLTNRKTHLRLSCSPRHSVRYRYWTPCFRARSTPSRFPPNHQVGRCRRYPIRCRREARRGRTRMEDLW